MLKKTITYENADGEMVTRDFYFHITQAELMEEMLLDPSGDLEGRLRHIVNSEDRPAIMREFKKLISSSVGKRTADGDFIKTPEYAQVFMASEAYSELFGELMTNTTAITEFVNGLMPKKLREQAAAAAKAQDTKVVELPNSGVIEGVVSDATAQASKPQPNFPQPTPFPQSLESAIAASQDELTNVPQQETSGEPAWLREMRSPTKKELMAMSRDEMQLAMKMKANGVLT